MNGFFPFLVTINKPPGTSFDLTYLYSKREDNLNFSSLSYLR
ncbi:unnamed protein product [marine sediment metagenome]|uniref:Uncharacterized protein n=1 Tax=marine sediment metagenome TaxID=412755 RepID=X0VIL6_9ZZZZ